MKRLKQSKMVIPVLVLLVALVLAAGGSVAQGAPGLAPESSGSAGDLASVGVGATAAGVTVDKDVEPKLIDAGDPVIYTVTFDNDSKDVATVDEIRDTLPTGFTFAGIEAASDIQQAPVGITGTIVWDGPFEVPAKGSLTLIYRANTGGGESTPTNEVTAVIDGKTVGPESAPVEMAKRLLFLPILRRDFSYASFSVNKSASPDKINVEELVTYTVLLRNEGDLPGKLDEITDTLPEGFTFDSMVAGSDIMAAPTGTTGTIVWDAEIDVAPGGELELVYRARAGSKGGILTNSATATTLVGFAPEEPAVAPVKVIRPSSFEDDFEDGIDEWTPYTNAKRANEDMWFWDLGAGRGGGNAYTHNGLVADKEKFFAHDALSMYLGEDSQEWTNYRYTVWFNQLGGRQVGIWLRGHYREVETRGQWVTGYYFSVKVRDDERDTAKLWQLRTTEEHGDEVHDYYWYHFQNPLLLEEFHLTSANVEKGEWHKLTVEVRGNNIKGYVDDELAIDHTDTVGSVFLTGTVGLYAYGSSGAYSVVRFDDVKVEPLD